MTGPPQPSPAAGPVVPAPRSGPPAPGVGVPPPAGKPRNRKLRLWLAMGVGILSLLCLGGIGVFISLYDEATEIQRSEPDAVVDSFLRAYLVNRDDKEAALFQCKAGGDLSQLAAFRTNIESTEKTYTVGVRITWTALDVAQVGGGTTVGTDLVRTLSDNSERDSKRWQFTLVDENGWRVCGASGEI